LPDDQVTEPSAADGQSMSPEADSGSGPERVHGVRRRVRYWWWDRSDLQVWILKWGTAVFLIGAALFVGTALKLCSATAALDVLLGTASPFAFGGSRVAVLTVPLAVFGWLLVPALTGAIVGGLLDESVRYWTRDEAERDRDRIARVARRQRDRRERKERRRANLAAVPRRLFHKSDRR
jgi:hypothetical protein